MCPDWESNEQHFGSQAGTQSTELHQQGKLRHSDILRVSVNGQDYEGGIFYPTPLRVPPFSTLELDGTLERFSNKKEI